MNQFPRFDRVVKRQRQQILSMLITFALFVGGAIVAATSLAACAPGEAGADDAIAATLDALNRSDADAAAPFLAPGLACGDILRAMRQDFAGARFGLEETRVDGDDVLSRIVVDDGTPLPALILLRTGHDAEGRIRSWCVVERADRAPLQ